MHTYMVACARVALRWTSVHACSPMHASERQLCFLCEVRYIADFAHRYFTERPVITRSVYLEFPELLFLWSTEPPLIAPDVIRTTPLNSSAVTNVHSIWNFMVSLCAVKIHREIAGIVNQVQRWFSSDNQT